MNIHDFILLFIRHRRVFQLLFSFDLLSFKWDFPLIHYPFVLGISVVFMIKFKNTLLIHFSKELAEISLGIERSLLKLMEELR